MAKQQRKQGKQHSGRASPKVRQPVHQKEREALIPLEPDERTPTPRFPIVGIGASAGGLEASSQLLQNLPADLGMALVLVQHLDPTHESMLTELLSRVSKMPVRQVRDGMAIERNQVYVIPPNMIMSMVDSSFKLSPREPARGRHMPIDYFFRSLASSHRSRAIGVILSGTASDGALGLEAIKGEGGLTFVQDDQTAKFPGMPRSAIATGSVDFILPIDQIASELVRIGKHPYIQALPQPAHAPVPESDETVLRGILRLLHRATEVDFTLYKPTTVRRRIMRRMTVHKLESLPDYLAFLKANPSEVDALYSDILIKVTGFFRDPEVFEALKRTAFPNILRHQLPGKPIRIWVPGCATGEGAYSIAICLVEFLGEKAHRIPIQIFATDIHEQALVRARAGQYIENIELDVSPARLRRFFSKVDSRYHISKNIREMCVFAKQNLLKDPPFSNVDLISCRNVLIYLGPASHAIVIPLFHYALKPNGFLMLGSSEAIGSFSDLFAVVDKKNKIFGKRVIASRPHVDFAYHVHPKEPGEAGDGSKEEPLAFREIDLQKEADRLILNAYAPPAVLINDQMEVLQFRGDTSHFLMPAPGRASFDLLRMAREGLMVELRHAIQEAGRKQSQVVRERVPVGFDGEILETKLHVIPVKHPAAASLFYIVLFEETAEKQRGKRARETRKARAERVRDVPTRRLKEELVVTRQHLQSIIEEYEAANEELKSANEEILSSNEELQSTNEELETAKEELQSTNEELTTMNEEMQNRNRDLAQVNDDLQNLLASANLALVVLGRDLHIRICTMQAERLLKLRPGDIGRPITELHLAADVPDLESLIGDAIEKVHILEREVGMDGGQRYTMWVRPYKTTDNRIDGAVLVFWPANVPAVTQAEPGNRPS